MVQFSGFASLSLCIQLRILHRMQWVSPFGHRGIIALLPAPPRFSQAYTSFVAYHRQGIHLMHLFTWLYHFKNFSDFAWHSVDENIKLEFPTLIKLTACCVLIPPFVFGIKSIQSSPKYCTCFSFPIQETTDRLQSVNHQKQIHCLCLLISAFQFVKDRCVQYCYLLCKLKEAVL